MRKTSTDEIASTGTDSLESKEGVRESVTWKTRNYYYS